MCIRDSLDVYRIFPGSLALVVHVAGGSTSFEEITVSHPPTNGDRLSTVVTWKSDATVFGLCVYLT